MKRVSLFLLTLFLVSGVTTVNAQVHVNVNVNVNAQPEWGPIGYDYVEYYYLPDIDMFYYVPRRQFVYISNGRWIFATSLPVRYRSYDLYRGYKVVVNDPYPYKRCDVYRARYGRYKGWNGRQVVIRDRPGHGNGRGHHGRH
jgi:hypothetical protein